MCNYRMSHNDNIKLLGMVLFLLLILDSDLYYSTLSGLNKLNNLSIILTPLRGYHIYMIMM